MAVMTLGVVFRYVDGAGNATTEANINGSVENIAGILNERRNVLGMMPHPENAIEPAQGGVAGCLRRRAAAWCSRQRTRLTCGAQIQVLSAWVAKTWEPSIGCIRE